MPRARGARASIRSFAERIEASRAIGLFLLLMMGVQSGCATYSDKLEVVRREIDRGAEPAALAKLNGLIGVRSEDELPKKWKGDRPLAVLERAVLLQAAGKFASSARDLSGSETELELLDLKTDSAGQIGKYIYSDSAQDYEASPTERLALNGFNMLNFLALGNLPGAAVEARRFTDMRDYLDSIQLPNMGSFGAYLAGFVFERMGEGDRALRYYEEALQAGPLESLARPVARLARANPYRGPRLRALLEAAPNAAARSGSFRADARTAARTEASMTSGADADAEILVVMALGRVPYKVPERIPIGAAIGFAGTYITGNPKILERSLFKVVVYPELVASGTSATVASVAVDGASVAVEPLSHLGGDIRKEYERIKPRILGAALTRMIARAAVAEGARVAGREAGREAGGGAAQIIGLLAALAAEGSLVALDKPDTRSWTLLPDRVFVSRLAVRPGEHQVEVKLPGRGGDRSIPVRLDAGGFAVVVVTVPR